MPEISVESEGPLGWIIINNEARLNALTSAMWHQFPSIVDELEHTPDIRVIILRGAGERAFSAGADISEFDEMRQGKAAEAYNQANSAAFQALRNCSKPTLSMVQGYCFGGGMLLALASDLRLACEGATFSLPPARLGLGFDLDWTRLVLSVLTPSFAREMLFTGGRFSASELFRHGALNRVHAQAALEEETRSLALKIAGNAPLSVQAFKFAIDDLSAMSEDIDRSPHDARTKACFDSADYQEGRRAFSEKRTPLFKGV